MLFGSWSGNLGNEVRRRSCLIALSQFFDDGCGQAARGDDDPERSDLDLLVEYEAGKTWTNSPGIAAMPSGWPNRSVKPEMSD